MEKLNGRLAREVYPVALLGILAMTWAITTYGVVPGADAEPHNFQHKWNFKPDQSSVGPVCAIESRNPASEHSCSLPTGNNSKTIPQLQLQDHDLSWIASRVKKWMQRNEAGGGVMTSSSAPAVIYRSAPEGAALFQLIN